MDIATISGAYAALKAAKDTIQSITELKIETEAISQINEAVKQVSEAQETLFQLREELFKLQAENQDLKTALSEKEEWEKRISNYELVETSGGAVVYQVTNGTPHFACPSCIEKKEIQILQNRRVYSGHFDCPGCNKAFPVNEVKAKPKVRRKVSSWKVR